MKVMAAESEERRAKKRARYLDRMTVLDRRVCLALAYREMGYSHSGVAERIDATTGTVGAYMDRVVARFGPEAVFAKPEDERGDLDPVSETEPLEWPEHYRATYREAATDCPDLVPDEVDP